MARKSYLSACLCYQNAASCLPEWLAFYEVLGVEHFYLYNNDSTEPPARCLKAYQHAGKATLMDVSGRGVQRAIYNHCLSTYGERTRWMMFCDDDEFLFPVRDITLAEALTPYERHAGVGVSWMMYGSSGHVQRPADLVIASFTHRAACPDRHVKCVVNPEKATASVLAAHQFRCRGALMVDEKFHPLRGPFAPHPTTDVLRINHYATKSKEELIERRSRVQVNTGELSPLSIRQWLQLEATYNEIEDRIADRYIARVRARMEDISQDWSNATEVDPHARSRPVDFMGHNV